MIANKGKTNGSENGGAGGPGGGAGSVDVTLMTFRTNWLRAVAQAWSDPQGYGDKLARNPAAALAELGFAWPWEDTIKFSVARNQGLKWLGEDWVWPGDKEDSLTLYLPISKRPEAERLRPRALADYYAQRPSIFGLAGGGGGTPRGRSLITSAGFDITPNDGIAISDFMLSSAPVRFAGNTPRPGGFTPSSGSFMDFEVVLLSALAKAWSNPEFAKLIASNDPMTFGAVIGLIHGYSSPWRLTLKVLDDKNAQWDEKSSRWQGLTPHQLTLNLPDAPTVHDQPVALAAYNSTGAEFPFTCCA